jgi:hypothetical protein
LGKLSSGRDGSTLMLAPFGDRRISLPHLNHRSGEGPVFENRLSLAWQT